MLQEPKSWRLQCASTLYDYRGVRQWPVAGPTIRGRGSIPGPQALAFLKSLHNSAMGLPEASTSIRFNAVQSATSDWH